MAVLAAFAGVAVIAITNSIATARETKLAKDVVTINAALTTYIANGGDLDGATTSTDILERLKTRISDTQQDQLVGVRAAFLDQRITPVPQTTPQAATTEPRVLWDATKNRFVMKYSGAAGIRSFELDDSKASNDEAERDRELSIEYSKKGDNKWVWEYGLHATAGTGTGNVPPGGTTGGTGGGYTPNGPLQLDPPTISIPGDTYPIIDYEGLEVTLTDPNPNGISEMFYSVVPGVWERYASPIRVEPGTNLETQSITLHPETWSDSATTRDEYRTEPVLLDLEVVFTQTLFDYVSLGGVLVPGSTPASPIAEPGDATITNLSSVPIRFQNSSVFQIFWTFDGTDPLTSGTAVSGVDFVDGFPGQPIPFGIDDWASSDTLTINAVAKSLDPSVVTDSPVMTYSLDRQPIQLDPPILNVNQFGGTFDLDLDTSTGTTPVGARIYYTQNGNDPGIAGDGEPLEGALHDGDPITPSSSSTLIARTYAPVAYSEWFLPSESVEGSIAVAGSDDLYIGGDFSAGSGHRNVARLAADGSLDMAFNPGAGASAGSVVGALQTQGGAGVLAGGNFETMDGLIRPGIARLRFDGSVDTSFNAGLE